MIRHKRLLYLLHYEPSTGIFLWRITRGGNALIGDIAGTPLSNGYISIYIDGKRYLAHRLAWFYMTGKWPNNEIDHENTINDDNRWVNLREATSTQNKVNSKLRIDNTSGAKGVSFHSRIGRWRATISNKHIGYFDTKKAAIAARKTTAKDTYGKYIRH